MDLNHIRLQGPQLANLYANALVELGDAPAPLPIEEPVVTGDTDETPPALPSYLGQNSRGILVITADASSAYLGDAELGFLTNVLGACNLGLGDVAIVNWERRAGHSGNTICDGLNARQILLFDVAPDRFGLPVNFPAFQVQALAGKTYLHAPALSTIAADKELKKALWTALKKLFSV